MKESLNAYKQIRTVSGQYVNVFEPDPATILIEDIAHALAHQCRFGGHLPEFYSVGQHSYLCSLYVNGDDVIRFAALMHDASEAYLLDMPKPIKIHLAQYNEIEDNLMKVIALKFGFEYPKSKEVEDVDHFMLEMEWDSIMLRKESAYFEPIQCMSPKEAKEIFLLTFNSYKK